jgi:hypothetical protein
MPLTRGVASDGTATSTFNTGSSKTGRHCGMPSRMPICAAVRNAMSEESTEW